MDTPTLLADAFGRIQEDAYLAAEGRTAAELAYQPDPAANSIAWLVWHLARVEDGHMSEIADLPQAWISDGWAERFGREPDPHDVGFGHTPEQVRTIRPAGPELLLQYLDAVTARTLEYLPTITPDRLDRIIDERWDPPVSVGVRIVSVIDDCTQHAGQANYVRGLLERLG